MPILEVLKYYDNDELPQMYTNTANICFINFKWMYKF